MVDATKDTAADVNVHVNVAGDVGGAIKSTAGLGQKLQRQVQRLSIGPLATTTRDVAMPAATSIINSTISNTSTVLLMGETGSGKSTLVNGLANMFAGSAMQGISSMKVAIATPFLPRSPEFAYVAVSEAGGSSTMSQTGSCRIYKLQGLVNGIQCTFNVVDSPGLSDTRGLGRDSDNMQNILSTVKSFPSKQLSLTALVLVLNGAVARHTINVKNMLTGLRGNMPDVVLQNLFVVCTNYTKLTCNTNEISLKKELGLQPTTNRPEAMKNIDKQFNILHEGRFKLMQILHGAKLEMQKLNSLVEAMDAAELKLKHHANTTTKFANYTSELKITTTELVNAPYHSTICKTCNVVCHNMCGLTEISVAGDNAFLGCCAFSGASKCQECKCSHTSHYHGKKTMVEKVDTIATVLADVKAKSDAAVVGRAAAQGQVNTASSARAQIEASIKVIGSRMLQQCQEIKSVCSGFNVVDELKNQVTITWIEAKQTQDFRVRAQMDQVNIEVENVCNAIQMA
ncbi:hypothetical protein FOA52_014722 [Chlamydomonas sp. UWO 241]|nr:hypothetical protein FOA52_014722 [Chlamydomonas sp. UWO 241]